MSHYPAALQNPQTTTVARRPGSARRTSHIDMNFRDGGRLELAGSARDLRTVWSGDAAELAAASVRALLGPTRQLEELSVSPATDVDDLLGLVVAGGFRKAVDRVVPEHRDLQSPLYLLLDDLPVAALISGYATLYLRGNQPMPSEQAGQRRGPPADICSGWRSDGVMMQFIEREGGIPLSVGPSAPRLERPDDPLGWHSIPPLASGAMRRRRLIDVARVHGGYDVSAMFRDSHVDDGGEETILHEYELSMELEKNGERVRSCSAAPRTLPWPECPAAAASATRLEGHDVSELRGLVRSQFHGTSTCTHLNDLLRSLADVGVLVSALR
jgi:Protein of unknown function (DUF2889)